MFEVFGRGCQVCRGSGANAGRIKRGRVVVLRYGSAAIWGGGVIVCPEIGRPGVSAERGLHARLRGQWGRCCENKASWG